MMGYGGWGYMMGFGGLGMVVSLLFWIGVVVLVVWAAAKLFPGRAETGRDTALEILKRRYAAGEISSAEFQQAKQDLVQ